MLCVLFTFKFGMKGISGLLSAVYFFNSKLNFTMLSAAMVGTLL